MICPSCSNNYDWKDFYAHDICYKCQYKEKLSKQKLKCPICREAVPKGRWRYCSEKCGEIGALTQRRNYLRNMRKINLPDYSWKDHSFKNLISRQSPINEKIYWSGKM